MFLRKRDSRAALNFLQHSNITKFCRGSSLFLTTQHRPFSPPCCSCFFFSYTFKDFLCFGGFSALSQWGMLQVQAMVGCESLGPQFRCGFLIGAPRTSEDTFLRTSLSMSKYLFPTFSKWSASLFSKPSGGLAEVFSFRSIVLRKAKTQLSGAVGETVQREQP